MNWTPKQQIAIEHDNEVKGNAIVSAAAGSGKTAVLVQRITELLSDTEKRIPANKIAAVTFTVAAADELRARLETAIEKKLTETDDPLQNEWLEEQLIRLDDAKISTINSFCLDIVRQYADEFGFSRDFRILDDSESAHCADKALEYALEALHEEPFSDDDRKVLRQISGKPGDSEIGNMLLDLDRLLAIIPSPEKWLDEKETFYDNPELIRPLLVEPKSAKIKEDLNECLDLILDSESVFNSLSEKDKARIESDRRLIDAWRSADLTKPDTVEPLLDLKVCDARYSTTLDGVKDKLKANQSRYKALLEKISQSASMIISFDTASARHAKAFRAIIKLYRVYDKNCREEKIAANGMTFSDTEHFCYKLLTTDAGTAQEISQAYYQIIVDEFQDCNRLQCEIFRALNCGGKKLYYVGDVKQLIYRFRSSDPAIFAEIMRDETFTPLPLNMNFRSNSEVISAVNGIFTGLMTEERGGVLYDKDASLECGLKISGGENYLSELVVLTGNSPDKNAEPLYIASRIREMIDNGFQIADKKNGFKYRKVRYSDFAVITSALAPVEDKYTEAFERYGLPYVRGGKGDFVALWETETVLDLLKVIENPYNDKELLGVMFSPLFGFTPDETATIRLFCNNGGRKSLFLNLIMFADNNDAAPDLRDKTERLYLDILQYQSISKNRSVTKLIRYIYEKGVFEPLIASSKTPEKALANIHLLLHYSEQYAKSDNGTLTGFISMLTDIRKKEIEIQEADAVESGDGGVKLLTIHASKGLEYPVCFIAGTNKRFNKRELHRNIVFDKNVGLAMRYIDEDSLIRYHTLTFDYVKERIDAELISEEMRKLYVAATRARDKLIFIADITSRTESSSFYTWIEGSLLRHDEIKRVEVDVSKITPPAKAAAQAPEAATTAENYEIIQTANEIDPPYERRILTAVPRKLSATQIGVLRGTLAETSDEPSVFPRNPSFLKDSSLTGKKRGDAYHKAMYKIDFKKGDYENQLEQLRPLFTPAEFKAINPAHITGFFESPLGLRVIKSDRIEKEYPLYTELWDYAELGLSPELNDRFTERPFIQGVADIFFYEKGKIILVDYKTNRGQSEAVLTEEYSKQLMIYKKAISEMTGAEVSECYLYSFELGEIRVK